MEVPPIVGSAPPEPGEAPRFLRRGFFLLEHRAHQVVGASLSTPLEETMFRLAAFLALLLFAAVGTSWAAQYGTSEEAKALLEKAVAAVKQDKSKALDMFNKGEGGFKDRDLYVACANASDGVVTAHPYLRVNSYRTS